MYYTLYVLDATQLVTKMLTVGFFPSRAVADGRAALLEAKLRYPAHTLVTVTTQRLDGVDREQKPVP